AGTKTPPDAYRGADRAKLKALVLAEWKERFPQDQVLGVRLVSPSWGPRTKRREWSSGGNNWIQHDSRGLSARVLVKDNAQEAWVYQVGISQDFTKGGRFDVGIPWKKPNKDNKM